MKTLTILLCLLISACSNLPKTITDVPARDIQVNQVADKSSLLSGHTVRWGGIIAEIDVEQNATGVQVLSYPLGSYGRPLSENPTGRFYFKTQKFLDPAIYTKGTEITIYGALNGEINKTVGKKSLTLPVVDAQDIYLWRQRRQARYHHPGYWPYHYGYYGHYAFPHSRFGFGHYGRYSSFYGYRGCY